MKRAWLMPLLLASMSAGCAEQPVQRASAPDRAAAEPAQVAQAQTKPPAPEAAVSQALLPPLVVEMPRSDGARPAEPRFDLNVNNAPAAQVFMAIASGTRYDMIVHPDVRETVSVKLKDTTVIEALDTLRDLYGYDYRVQGNRILVQPVGVQSRVYRVNYLQAGRGGSGAADRSRAAAEDTFWSDIVTSIRGLTGTADGRSVIANAQSGVIVVRALPAELRSVESFLRAMQLIVDRQMVLEAKIVTVVLKEGIAGVNWAGFRDEAAGGEPVPPTPAGASGFALRTGSFPALLAFLETQGTVNVLSSPRVATINNQKAVLKVGTDDYFVTQVSAAGAGGAAPAITVQPFFSGIALDVTPRIDDNNSILLHVHPQVSRVVERRKVVDLGKLGTVTLPLASSSINETDTIVRVRDGNIVAIGGLLWQDAAETGGASPQPRRTGASSELVILIKPTIVPAEPQQPAGPSAKPGS